MMTNYKFFIKKKKIYLNNIRIKFKQQNKNTKKNKNNTINQFKYNYKKNKICKTSINNKLS